MKRWRLLEKRKKQQEKIKNNNYRMLLLKVECNLVDRINKLEYTLTT